MNVVEGDAFRRAAGVASIGGEKTMSLNSTTPGAVWESKE